MPCVFKLEKRSGFSQRHYTQQTVTPYLRSLETKLAYHRSAVTLTAIERDVQSFGNSLRAVSDYELQLAIDWTRKQFDIGHDVPMLHLNDLFHYPLKIWSSSPGLPWREIGYKTKRDVVRDVDACKQIRWFWHRIKNGDTLYAPDCCAFVRSHLCEPNENKVRAVWGYPFTMTIGEAVFAVPLIEEFQKGGTPLAYGYETAIGGARKIVAEASRYKYKAAIDFKSFDKTVPEFLIEAAFNILAYRIDFINYRDYGVADARRMIRMYRYIQRYFSRTPIRLCNGNRYRKKGGVASGSYFTQLVDSVVNTILVCWITLKQTGAYPQWLKVMGDDSLVATEVRLDLDDADELVQTLGMKINVMKSSVSRHLCNLTFLGYQLNDGIPTREHDKWMAALLYPEVPDNSWDEVATRALGLIYACSGTDDKFDHLCRTICNLRPFDLAISRSLSRMIRVLGIEWISKEPPDRIGFLQRLGIF